jgi:hypothetical protein
MTQDESNIIELEDTFFLHGHPTKPYLLKLSSISLSIIPKHDENDQRNRIQSIPIDDIYGCLCMKSNSNPIICHLTFYLYGLKRSHGISGVFSKKNTLHRSQRIFTYATYDDFERNHAEVIRWHRYVKQAIYLRQNLPRNFNEIFF